MERPRLSRAANEKGGWLQEDRWVRSKVFFGRADEVEAFDRSRTNSCSGRKVGS